MEQIEHQYLKLLQDILDNGVEKETRNGNTISVFGRQIRHKMSDGFPLLTTKKMAWKSIVTELIWFLRGDTNIKYLVDNNCHIWDGDAYKNYINKRTQYDYDFYEQSDFILQIKTDDEFANEWGELGPIYGAQWRKWDGIDQIQEVINTLKTNPDSRRMLVSAWNVNYLDEMVLPPCHYGFQVYTRELSVKERMEIYFKQHPDWAMIGEHSFFDKHNIPTRAISLMFNMRSTDVPLGLPFNIASYGLLLEIFGKMVNMVPDELIANLGDAHIYKNQIDGVKEQLTREPYELPMLNINTEWWPTESGECGEGPLDATAIFNGFNSDNFCKCLLEEDIQLGKYQSHPSIKMPLSN